MPWLPMYLTPDDAAELLAFLNSETVVAFIVADGPRRWRAVTTLAEAADGRFVLWHHPAGVPPLLRDDAPDEVPDNPWAGWEETLPGLRPFPSIDPAAAMILSLNLRTRGREQGSKLGLSSFEWIGNRYRSIGAPAESSTEAWWRRLGAWVRKRSVRVPRKGTWDGQRPEIWAAPSALQLIQRGAVRDVSP